MSTASVPFDSMGAMNAWEPIGAAALADEDAAPCVVTEPPPGAALAPLVFASPHSGRVYPPEMMAAAQLGAAAIRRSEDAYVDALIEDAPAFGASLIVQRLARVYMEIGRAHV